jgi:methylated-DNA-[protein]-cysteine S-methyltransferase
VYTNAQIKATKKKNPAIRHFHVAHPPPPQRSAHARASCYSGFMETAYYWTMASPVGPLTVCSSRKGLLRVDLRRGKPADTGRFRWIESKEKTGRAVAQLEEYFAGRRRTFALPLDLRGTVFQRKVWRALQRIPYGATCCYGDIARRIGRPIASRAVGQANHHNPLAIVVPCHRVIASGGGLGGYGGGLKMKRRLLALEQGARC